MLKNSVWDKALCGVKTLFDVWVKSCPDAGAGGRLSAQTLMVPAAHQVQMKMKDNLSPAFFHIKQQFIP